MSKQMKFKVVDGTPIASRVKLKKGALSEAELQFYGSRGSICFYWYELPEARKDLEALQGIIGDMLEKLPNVPQ